jgi:hypothetical protein
MAARHAEAADPWRGRDRLLCAWREPKACRAGPPPIASRRRGSQLSSRRTLDDHAAVTQKVVVSTNTRLGRFVMRAAAAT